MKTNIFKKVKDFSNDMVNQFNERSEKPVEELKDFVDKVKDPKSTIGDIKESFNSVFKTTINSIKHKTGIEDIVEKIKQPGLIELGDEDIEALEETVKGLTKAEKEQAMVDLRNIESLKKEAIKKTSEMNDALMNFFDIYGK